MLENLFFSNKINLAFNLSNALLFLVGLIFLGLAFYKLIKNSREVKIFNRLFKGQPGPYTKDQVHEWMKTNKFSSTGVLSRAVQILDELSATTMEDRDVITYLEDVRNDIRTAVPKVVPGLAVLLGFLGTVLGLYLAIISMPKIFENTNFGSVDESFTVLTNSMVSALDGMGVAFGTTLVGLFVSLVLTVGNLIYSIFWKQLDRDFLYLMNIKLFPIYNKPDDDNITNQLLESIKASKETMNLIRGTNDRLIESVQGLSKSMARYNQKAEQMVRQVSSAVEQFIETQKENKGVFGSISKIAEEASKSYGKVERLLNTAQQDRTAFLDYLQDSRDEIKEISTLQHKAYVKTNEEFLELQKQSGEEQFKAQKKLYDSQFDRFSDEHHKYQEAFEQLRQKLVETVQKEYDLKIKDLKEHNDMLTQRIEELAEKTAAHLSTQLESTSKSVEENSARLNETVDNLSETLEKNSKQYESDTTKLIKQLSSLIMKTIETNNYYIR
ncbi:MAG: MotA/TolQ/ExbB proton channel family protein [Lewinellaceae bacterium]|nr:MotA/TolQ/ExbB proton channel family protein [Lewinellaceae bacterium]